MIRLTVEELRRLKGEPLPDEELRRAKDHLKGSLMLSLENTGSRMSHLARQEIYFGRQFGLDELLAGIEAVEADDVQRIARTLFKGSLGHEHPGQPRPLPPEAGAPSAFKRTSIRHQRI